MVHFENGFRQLFDVFAINYFWWFYISLGTILHLVGGCDFAFDCWNDVFAFSRWKYVNKRPLQKNHQRVGLKITRKCIAMLLGYVVCWTCLMMTSSNGNIFRVTGHSPYKGQWRGALMFSLICTLTNSWVNNRDAGDLRRHRAHYDVTVMWRQVC